ncbi:hypothetical protein [Rivularia sp. UHCC 0363]|uniref:hypothetical protein n=1 Tax=Rivularia sp. UHCC 0363 TaxID=3110244 RepID=UPI002B1EE86B|nr:hypothetical protein [Rivularia sp. UHCC 0363]MEA5594815.1 hypothetical protein [Rivularia sp. UHCC 0363]
MFSQRFYGIVTLQPGSYCDRVRKFNSSYEKWSLVIGHWALGIGNWELGIGHWA